MTDDGEGDGNEDGVVATEVLVGNDGAYYGRSVGPERVEGTNTERGTLAHVEGTGYTIFSGVSSSGLEDAVNHGQGPLDKVGVYSC